MKISKQVIVIIKGLAKMIASDFYFFFKIKGIRFVDKIFFVLKRKIAFLNNNLKTTSLNGVFYRFDKYYNMLYFTSVIKEVNGILSNIEVNLDNYRFIDVGANIGMYSYAAHLLKPELNISSFEPVKNTFQHLRQNLQNISNIKLKRVGIGDKKQNTSIYYDRKGLENSSILNKQAGSEKEKINIQSLDSLFNEGSERFIMKVDVEGYEEYVLKGAQNILDRIDLIYIEVNTKYTNWIRLSQQISDDFELKDILHVRKDKKYLIADFLFFRK